MKRTHNESVASGKQGKDKGKPTTCYISDAKLVPRINQYIQTLKSKKHVSVTVMAEELQRRYSEYGRKKKNAFRVMVEKVYNTMLSDEKDSGDSYSKSEKKHLEKRLRTSSDSDDDKSFSSENEDYVQVEDTNSMNSFMTNMYKQNKSLVSGETPRSQPASPRTRQVPALGSHSLPSSPRQHGSASPVRGTPLYVIDRLGDRTPNTSLLRKHETSNPVKVNNSEIVDMTGDSPMPADVATVVETVPQLEQENEKASTKVKVDEKKTPGRRLKKKDEKKKGPEVQQSNVKFADIGGNEKTLQEVCKLLVHMKHPEVYEQLGVTPPRGFLLHGPPGCGKTLLAHAIAGELELPFIKLAATEIVSGVSGESEEKVRDIFSKAVASSPCILFLDEIDSITQKRENASKDMERRIVSQLLTSMDDLNMKTGSHVLVIGATNRPDSLDPALRRAGRFDREISMGIPDEQARIRILEVLCRNLRLSEDFRFLQLARWTPGFVGADLMALAREAAIIAVNRVFNDLQSKSISHEELSSADISSPTQTGETAQEPRETVALEAMEGLTTVPLTDTTLPDVGSVERITQLISSSVLAAQNEGTIKDSLQSGSISDVLSARPKTDSIVNATPVDLRKIMPECPLANETKNTDIDNLNRVLKWLKDQPPLTGEQLASLYITMADFQEALKHVQPSAKREGFATVPDITWDDIGALQEIRQELEISIMAPVQHPEHFKSLGLSNPPGILLAGPPGCGKTLLAKAVANESGINFISVKGPELLNMYVGESERAVRQVFQRARNSAPCVIFFDELDALCPKRSHSGDGGSSTRVVNQLLTEMDGLEERKQVFIMGATNRPDIIDPAVLRPGRLDKLLYVGLPSESDRFDILKTITKNGTKPKLDESVNLQTIAADLRCQNFTGADLSALVREAAVAALRDFLINKDNATSIITVMPRHFHVAFTKVKPSVSEKDKLVYESMKTRLEIS